MPSIAIVGASSNREKFGNKAVRAYRDKGYTVYPVHPKETEIEGLKAYPSVRDIPVEKVDAVSMYVSPAIALGIIDDIASKSPAEVWFNPGSESDEVLEKAEAAGLNAIAACSIVGIGKRPSDY